MREERKNENKRKVNVKSDVTSVIKTEYNHQSLRQVKRAISFYFKDKINHLHIPACRYKENIYEHKEKGTDVKDNKISVNTYYVSTY